MLAKLRLKLKSSSHITREMSSLFHGAILELLDAEYTDRLHRSSVNPYSMYLSFEGEDTYLHVMTLTKEAYERMIPERLDRLETLDLRHNGLHIEVEERVLEVRRRKTLLEDFYKECQSPQLIVEFCTPTAFKQKGKYLFLPDIRCIYQSLLNKYEETDEDFAFKDEDTLFQLTEHTNIRGYRLKSIPFALEGITVPGFIGELRLSMFAPQPLINLANILFEFGTYSGVGIKTSMGMGGIRLHKGGKKFEQTRNSSCDAQFVERDSESRPSAGRKDHQGMEFVFAGNPHIRRLGKYFRSIF